MRSLLITICVLGITATLATDFIVKEEWKIAPQESGWQRADRASGDERIQLTIAVRQSNLAELEALVLRVSDPDHEEYGKHLTRDEVNDLIKPEESTVYNVLSWLQESGIETESLDYTPNYDFIRFETSIAKAEQLLGAKYYHYEHESGESVIRCDKQYGLPAHMSRHIDFISPTIRFPVIQKMRVKPNNMRKLLQLGGVITPAILRELYGVHNYTSTSSDNLQACASFLGQFYSPSDLQTFFDKFDKSAIGQTPTLYGPNEANDPGIEASLDIQYIMAMGNNVSTQFWSTAGQQPHNPQNEPFLVWLFNVSALPDNNTPKVFSISYGDNEGGVNFDYAVRVNTEFQKLGARGVSIMFSSGDGGVAGGQSTPCTDFIPTFPAGSPWVTAVGGTKSSKPEVAASFSSGGFSNYWARPSYQDEAVTHYFNVAQNLPDSSRYNHTGIGIPDVSCQSESFNVIQNGGSVPFGVEGTSCASPSFSGIMSLVNDVRLNMGKSPLGFLNPLFYKNPDVFNDITSGNNPGCGTDGFYAAEGWDPVTGLGTPNFSKLVALAKSL